MINKSNVKKFIVHFLLYLITPILPHLTILKTTANYFSRMLSQREEHYIKFFLI